METKCNVKGTSINSPNFLKRRKFTTPKIDTDIRTTFTPCKAACLTFKTVTPASLKQATRWSGSTRRY